MILHVDMDAFYAAVEERDDPSLAGKPVIVGGSAQGRGVVSAANYPARKFGIHSAMPMVTAQRLCRHAVILPVRMNHYAAVSRQIREVFQRYTPLVEPLALDEAFLDVAGSVRLFGPVPAIGRKIKEDIRREVQLTASVGVAPNKFLAKVASDLEKPDGFVIVEHDRVQEFLDPLPISRIWGIGKVSGRTFEKLGIRTIGDLREFSMDSLSARFGEAGEHFWKLARGIDNRRVVPDRRAKTISHETTFEADVDDLQVLHACLVELTEQVARRLRRHGYRGRTVHLKLRFADFRTITRSRTIGAPTNVTQEILQIADDLLVKKAYDPRCRVRLLGLGVSGFEAGPIQASLFADEHREKQQKLDAVADEIKDKFGRNALGRASSLQRDIIRPEPK